jgi:hypothetical protein
MHQPHITAARRAPRRYVYCARHSSDSDSSHGSDSGYDGAAARRHFRWASASTSTAPARRWVRANTQHMSPHNASRGTRRPPPVPAGQGRVPVPGATRASVEVGVKMVGDDREDAHACDRSLVDGCPGGTRRPLPAGRELEPGAAHASVEVVVVEDREPSRARRLVDGRPDGAHRPLPAG